EPNAIIASSQYSVIFHHSRRKVIWFPPISNPKTLMDGIRRHHVEYVVVIKRGFNYYLPPETTCFDLLHAAYPDAFRLEDANVPVKIYRVLAEVSAAASDRAH